MGQVTHRLYPIPIKTRLKMMTARTVRKQHRCTYCAEQIKAGEQYVRWMSVDDGKAITSKMHPECLATLEADAYGGYFEYDLYGGERPPMTKRKKCDDYFK